jgi:hypothetical protein
MPKNGGSAARCAADNARMSAWLIAAVGVAYAYVAAEQALKGHWWLAIVFGGYALSNVGLWAMAKAQG